MATTEKGYAFAIYVSASKQPLVDEFDKIAIKLGVNRATLLWHYIEACVATGGPKAVKVTGTVRSGIGVGSSPGFWLIRKTDASGKVIGINVTEVVIRTAANGHTFYRYRKGDSKGRTRMLNSVKLAADTEAKAFGLGKFSVSELSGADLEAALTPATETPIAH